VDTFDDIEVKRPELARSYLKLLRAQRGRPLALFAPRRVGKTFFLDHDLAPIARKTGLLPVYADVWLQRTAPRMRSITHWRKHWMMPRYPREDSASWAKRPSRK
jgi:uncharacterized protein